jgi:hypothetical protein
MGQAMPGRYNEALVFPSRTNPRALPTLTTALSLLSLFIPVSFFAFLRRAFAHAAPAFFTGDCTPALRGVTVISSSIGQTLTASEPRHVLQV